MIKITIARYPGRESRPHDLINPTVSPKYSVADIPIMFDVTTMTDHYEAFSGMKYPDFLSHEYLITTEISVLRNPAPP